MGPSRTKAKLSGERSEARGITPTAIDALAKQIGVTRVARVTGLDRGGVEVACAMRPGGHILQVSNGKGLAAARARAGAVLEAAELWAAERPSSSRLVFATLAELEARGLEVWPLEEELLAPDLFSPELRIAWVLAQLLGGAPEENRPVFLPASIVHCVPSNGPWLGPAVHRWTSNGMGAHPDGELALRHALLEAAERDGLARALPQGWTEREIRRRKIELASLMEAAPETATVVASLARQGLSAQLFDLNPGAEGMELSLAGALLVDDEDGPIQIAAGYACAPGRDAALLGALLEAAQSRLTDVHGAREDIAPADREAMGALARAAVRAKPSRDANELPLDRELSSTELVARFAAAGFSEVAALDLAPPGCAARIMKVVVPGLLLSELL